MSLAEPASRAAARAREAEYVRLVAASTGDAAASAALLMLAFEREGIDVHLSFHDDLRPLPLARLADETCVFVLDGWCRSGVDLGDMRDDVVLLAHDNGAAPDGVLALTPGPGGLDGAMEASTSALAYLVAHALDRGNADLVALALAGATAERQMGADVGGLHMSLLLEAVDAGVAERRRVRALSGTLLEALTGAEPYLKGLSGRARGAQRLLVDLGLDPEADVATLDDGARARLHSAVALRLLQQGAPTASVEALKAVDVAATSGPLAGVSARDLGRRFAHAVAAGDASGAVLDVTQGRLPDAAPDLLAPLVRAEQAWQEGCEAPRGAADLVAAVVAHHLARDRPVVAWEPADDDVKLVVRAPPGARHDVAAAVREAVDEAPWAGHRLAARGLVPADAREKVLARLSTTWEAAT